MTNPIPITIITGFLGSGKTTLLLNLIPQLQAQNPDYRLALVKNEFGDVAVDSQLANASAIAGTRELLNGCICCNLVGGLGDALRELAGQGIENGDENWNGGKSIDRIVVETSGSAFPATLAMEVNRLSRETHGRFVLDGVVTCIDVENWAGYEDTSYTARIQAKYMDLVVFNKWEHVGERRWDECLDRLGDLGTDVAWVRSDKGKVPMGVIFGIDGGLARSLGEAKENEHKHEHGHEHAHGKKGHQSEVEVLSVTLQGEEGTVVNTQKLEKLLKSAPKDEVYRIKAVLAASSPIASSDESISPTNGATGGGRYILNWAFSRWTCTPLKTSDEHESSSGVVLRMTIILARYESTKWKKRIEGGCYIELEGDQTGVLKAEKII